MEKLILPSTGWRAEPGRRNKVAEHWRKQRKKGGWVSGREDRERERRKREQEVMIEDRHKHLAFLKNSKILS